MTDLITLLVIAGALVLVLLASRRDRRLDQAARRNFGVSRKALREHLGASESALNDTLGSREKTYRLRLAISAALRRN